MIANHNCIWLDDSMFEVDVEQKNGINELFEEFNQLGLKVSGIRPKANRLETLFVDMVRQG